MSESSDRPDRGPRESPLPGRSTRRVGGSRELVRRPPPIGPGAAARPVTARLTRGPYEDDSRANLDNEPANRTRAIGPKAESLLANCYRFAGFWDLCHRGATIEWAGDRILGLKKRQSHNIYNMLKEAGGPFRWFCDEVLCAMEAGEIPRGKETVESKLADAFFQTLSGKATPPADLTLARANRLRRDSPRYYVEAIDYVIHVKHLGGRREP